MFALTKLCVPADTMRVIESGVAVGLDGPNINRVLNIEA
jgi:hypothetical protein